MQDIASNMTSNNSTHTHTHMYISNELCGKISSPSSRFLWWMTLHKEIFEVYEKGSVSQQL